MKLGTYVLAAATGVGLVAVAVAAASGVAPTGVPQSAQTLERCVDRWNQMKMGWLETIAIVSSRPRCSVMLAYTFPSENVACDPPDYRPFPGNAKICESSTGAAFGCLINRFGAYECDTHAGVGPRVTSKRWNATVTQRGELVLDRPPKTRAKTPLPRWATRYPYENGYIVPWTNASQFRPGLTLKATGRRAQCYRGSEETRSSSALRCSSPPGPNATLLYDPCFAQHGSGEQAGVVVACAQAPGSTTFLRLVTVRFPYTQR
jgi:hypothetical protein